MRILWALMINLACLIGVQIHAEAMPEFENFETYHAHFTQETIEIKSGKQLFHTTGRVWLSGPIHFRWEVGTPTQQTVLRPNLKDLWVIEPPLEQAMVYHTAQHIAAQLPALLLSGDKRVLSHYFKFIRLSEQDRYVRYRLVPKQAIEVLKTVIIKMQDGHLLALNLEDLFGHLIRIKLKDAEFNKPIDSKIFALEIPSHYDTIQSHEGAGI